MSRVFRTKRMRMTAWLLSAAVCIGSMDINMLTVHAAQEGDLYAEENPKITADITPEADSEADDETVVENPDTADQTQSEQGIVPEGEPQIENQEESAEAYSTPEAAEADAPAAQADGEGGDAEPTEPQEVTISGITISNKDYDGQKAVACNGDVKATVSETVDGVTSEKDVTSDVKFECSVSGTNKHGDRYSQSCSLSAAASSIAGAINNIMPKDAGDYVISVAASNDSGQYTGKIERSFRISQRPVTITAGSSEIVVGGDKPSYECVIDGLVAGEELLNKDELEYSDDADTERVGAYVISVVGTDTLAQANYNYKITFRPGVLTVVDKTLATVSGIEIPGKEYDGNPAVMNGNVRVTVKDNATGSERDITGNMDITYKITGTDASGMDYTSDDKAQLPTNAGTYRLTVTASSAEYRGTLIKDFSISQKTIVIKPYDVTVSEGAEMPTFTYTIVDGALIGTDTFSREPKLTCTTDSTAKPGIYVITAKDAYIQGSNYTIKYETGTLTVLEKDKVSISGVTVSNKIYDGEPAEYVIVPKATVGQGTDVTDEVVFSYQIVGTQADNGYYRWSGADTDIGKGMPKNAGEYTLTVTVSDDEGKYKGTKDYKFEILPRKIIVKAKDKTIKTEEQIPMEFECEIGGDGFLDGDDFESVPRFFCEIENTDKPGSYPIVVSGARAGANYNISYVNGTLTVIEKEIEKTKNLVRIIEPDPITNVKNGISIQGIDLPETIKIITRDFNAVNSPYTDKTEAAQVEWVRQPIGNTSYQSGNKEEQIFMIGGTVIVPPDVDPGSVPTEVKIWVTVCEAWISSEAVASPTATIASGESVRSGTMVELKCATEEATIYYTLDGSIPTKPTKVCAPDGSIQEKKSNVYSAPIELGEHTTVIRAYAVKNGYPDSAYTKFTYFITNTVEDDDPDQPKVPDEDIPDDGIIPEGLWSTKILDYVYTGKAIKPEVRVYDYKTRLEEKKDYTITYKNNINAADKDAVKAPSIIITGKGNYEGKITKYFTITPKNINDNDVILDDVAVLYNKKAQKPVPTVTWNGKKLSNKKDYTVQEVSYTDVGTRTVNVTGRGNYMGERSFAFTITDGVLVSKLTVGKIPNQTYTGQEIRPEPVVKYKGAVLNLNQDYTVSYVNNKEVGTATAIIKGSGDYVGTKRVTFKITEIAALNKAKVEFSFGSTSVYTGKPISDDNVKVTVNVKSDGETVARTLREGKDYEVEYTNNVKAGTATATFTGKNAYSGKIKKTFKITAYDISKVNSRLEKSSYSYVKGGCKPEPVVKFGGKTLKAGTDYTLAYKQNNAAGSMAVLTIKGKGNFTGSKTLEYEITTQDIGKMTVTAADKVYQNKNNIYKTTVQVTDTNGKKLAAGKDYDKNMEYSYAEKTRIGKTNKKAGDPVGAEDIIPAGTKINVKITAKGRDYTGTVLGTYRITAASITKAKVSIKDQTYTGKAIELDTKADPQAVYVEVNGTALKPEEYEIVAGSYSNNINKGKAKVVIRGLGNYGGTKTATFKIKGKGLGLFGL